MDFEFYRNFITVAETGNLTTASKKLSLAQPALSAQIKTLEQYYGTKLIKTARGKRQLDLTEAGAAFLSKARQIAAPKKLFYWICKTSIKKLRGPCGLAFRPPKAPSSSIPTCAPSPVPIPKSITSSAKKQSAPKSSTSTKTAATWLLPTRPSPRRRCSTTINHRRNILRRLQPRCGQQLAAPTAAEARTAAKYPCLLQLRAATACCAKPAAATASTPKYASSPPQTPPPSTLCKAATASPSSRPAAQATFRPDCWGEKSTTRACTSSRHSSGRPKKNCRQQPNSL